MTKKPEDEKPKKTFFDVVGDQAKSKTVQPLNKLCCPACKEDNDLSARTTQWYIMYTCGKCKNKWDVAVRPNVDMSSYPPRMNAEGQFMDDEDVDYSDVPSFRDPSRNVGDD
jgi:hypothetical protein